MPLDFSPYLPGLIGCAIFLTLYALMIAGDLVRNRKKAASESEPLTSEELMTMIASIPNIEVRRLAEDDIRKLLDKRPITRQIFADIVTRAELFKVG